MPNPLLRYLCAPASIALIGASERPGSIGAALTRNLLCGGFQGELFLVNRRHRSLQDLTVWPRVADLPRVPELAIIATPPHTVSELLADLGWRGTQAVVVITATGLHSDAQSWRDTARDHGLRLIGPGSFGIIAPRHGLNVSLSPIFPQPGHLALIASSGMALTPLLEWATAQSFGFSSVIALGDSSAVGFDDLLDALADDPNTHAILLVLETLSHARSFLSAARAAARIKPVLAVRAGRSGDVRSRQHDAVYDAAFRRAGILRLQSLRELLSVAQTLAFKTPVKGNRLALFGNCRQWALLAADTLLAEGGKLASFSPMTRTALDKILPAGIAPNHPLDLGFDARPAHFAAVLELMLREPEIDAVLMLYAPNALTSATETAAALMHTVGRARTERPSLLTCWLGTDSSQEAQRQCRAQRIPSYDTPDDAVRAFIQRWRYQQHRIALMATPPDASALLSADVPAARHTIQGALTTGQNTLTAAQTRNLFAAYGIALATDEVSLISHSRSAPLELTIRMIQDPVFGPALWFGLGGSAMPADEFAIALPPLNLALARAAIAPTHTGWRLQNASTIAADLLTDFALLLVKVAQLITDCGEVTELELNPIIATADSITVGAAQIEITATQEPAQRRLAIRPYPRELEETMPLPDGSTLLIRPVRPEDEPALVAGFTKLSPDEVRMRFMQIVKELTHVNAARLTQIDYDREMALIALRQRDGREPEGCGVARIISDSHRDRAEFAIVLLRNAVGIGLSSLLLRRLMAYARTQGICELYGEILRENEPMLALCRAMGFAVTPCPEDCGVMIATLRLT